MAAPSESKTRRENVWRLLSDGQWHTTMEINAVGVGGSEGCRRVRELRQQVAVGKRPGYTDIVTEKVKGDTTQYRYRLVGPGQTHQSVSYPAPMPRSISLLSDEGDD